MGKVFIVCPECLQQLSFPEQPDWQNKLVECPKCRFKAKASVYRLGSQARGAHGADDSATQLVRSPQTVFDAGRIRVENTNEVHDLRAGSNVIGRCATTGTADIKIGTDMYMSRRHVQIDVVKSARGYEHHLVEINSKNIVKLNGKPINRGDVLILKFGDVLTLGTTEVVLESGDNESTRLV